MSLQAGWCCEIMCKGHKYEASSEAWISVNPWYKHGITVLTESLHVRVWWEMWNFVHPKVSGSPFQSVIVEWISVMFIFGWKIKCMKIEWMGTPGFISDMRWGYHLKLHWCSARLEWLMYYYYRVINNLTNMRSMFPATSIQTCHIHNITVISDSYFYISHLLHTRNHYFTLLPQLIVAGVHISYYNMK